MLFLETPPADWPTLQLPIAQAGPHNSHLKNIKKHCDRLEKMLCTTLCGKCLQTSMILYDTLSYPQEDVVVQPRSRSDENGAPSPICASIHSHCVLFSSSSLFDVSNWFAAGGEGGRIFLAGHYQTISGAEKLRRLKGRRPRESRVLKLMGSSNGLVMSSALLWMSH